MRHRYCAARLIILLISTLLVALAAPSFALALEPTNGRENTAKTERSVEENSLAIAYVSSNGDDATANDTKDNPFATLSGAVSAVKDGGSVVLLSDINASKLIYVSGKSITINGDGHIVTRADGFERGIDEGRGGYNPAMIEVANHATLKLENITLDDAFRTEGTKYELADTANKGNENKVQDGIIASYGDGHSTIILGSGCTLKNFGGNSAVYITGEAGEGAKLVLESGSQILDDHGSARKGGYAALFNHGGTAQIASGASIHDIDGRAIYSDNAGVTSLDGSVYNVTSNEVMNKFNGALDGGFSGVAYFAEGKSVLTVGSNGDIHSISSHDNQGSDVVIHLVGAEFVMQAGSRLHDIKTVGIVDENDGSIDLGGEIYGIESKNILFRMRGSASTLVLSESGSIHNCKTTDVGIVYRNGSRPVIKIAGTIRDVEVNILSGSVIYDSYNNQCPNGTIELTETGIIENVKGSAIRIDDPSDATIKGKIANCSGHAINYRAVAGSSLVIGNGSKIEGNGGRFQVTIKGESAATDDGQYALITAGTLIGNSSIEINHFGTIGLDSDYADIKLGAASREAADSIISKMNEEHADWTPVQQNALWFNPSQSNVHLTVDPEGKPKKTGLFAVCVPLNADGTAREKAELIVTEVKNETVADVTLKGLEAGTSYALMLFNNAEYSFAPDDVTMYTGGGHGDEKYTDGMSSVTIEDSVDLTSGDIESLEIKGEDISKEDGETLFTKLMDNLDVVYLDSDGNEVENDNVPGEYTSKLVWKNGLSDDDVRVNGNDVNLDDEGTLIVRHTSDKEHAKDGTITYPLLASEPTSPVEHAEAIAKGLNPSFYLNDQREIDHTEGIQILDDTLLASFNDGRQELLESKAVEYLGAPGEGQAYRFDFHYLDLVDAYNGNVWVSAEYGTTVYLPYPEGVTAETAESLGLKVVHYMDLHREYGIAGHAEVSDAIAACTLEAMNVEYTPNGIKFDVPRSGFSPFAVVWQTQAHSITATCGKGGTISPEGTITVADGADKTFAVSPDSGYSIDKILVDGKTLSDSSLTIEDGITYYTFEDVTSDHTIEATFKSDSVVDPGGDSSSSGDSGNKTDSTDKIPETGDTNSPVLAALLGASALSIFVAGVKRSKE